MVISIQNESNAVGVIRAGSDPISLKRQKCQGRL